MAPTVKVPRTTRTTRSSTRSQTQKSYDTDCVSNKPSTTMDTRKIEKKRTNATIKAKNAAGSNAKPDTNTKSAQSNQTKATSTSTSSPPTALTITTDLVKKPIICNQYLPQTSKHPPAYPTPFIFTHGAGGTLSAPAVVNFCNGFISTSITPVLAFQGSSNLGARVKGFQACREHVCADARDLVFGGRSMGARAAVVAATELLAEEREEGHGDSRVRLVLVSYPLQGPKDVRDGILLDLPEGVEVLFVVGDKDAMCPLDLLEEVRAKMKAKSRLVVVRGADHGMNIRPASRTKEIGEETGSMVARWMSGDVESEGGMLCVGEEE